MACFQPLERRDGRFDYTCTNDAGTFAIGYCTKWLDIGDFAKLRGVLSDEQIEQSVAKTRPFKNKYHCTGHATEAEACACYTEYNLDQHLRFFDDQNTQRKCDICAAWTTGGATLGEYESFNVCDLHKTRDAVKAIVALKKAKRQKALDAAGAL